MQGLVRVFDDLGCSSSREDNSLCSNIPAIEYHYAGGSDNLVPFSCDDEQKLVSCFESLLGYFSSPSKEDFEIAILVKQQQNIQQVNERKIRFLSTLQDTPSGWERRMVWVRKGTECFFYQDCCSAFLMTQQEIYVVDGRFIIG
ncbi:hypothetical protein pv_214 [Pithovirus sibericum]|uniref:Uncharacterized protein n=1 Tax=Pithovirus sibericum TaxID=1450746 RepID=W5S4Y5_9VIRU|nr:hypothetical protein pv_214 [Pithovirus sibericum]AHH01781.1 hypothetical protein pv_214 [Pithovirus sibericum]